MYRTAFCDIRGVFDTVLLYIQCHSCRSSKSLGSSFFWGEFLSFWRRNNLLKENLKYFDPIARIRGPRWYGRLPVSLVLPATPRIQSLRRLQILRLIQNFIIILVRKPYSGSSSSRNFVLVLLRTETTPAANDSSYLGCSSSSSLFSRKIYSVFIISFTRHAWILVGTPPPPPIIFC